ncbi:MAG: fumarylacetoacetate hydrolase family protein [Rhodoferax sp.]
MKLATYHDGSRDGQLVVVSRDLSQAHYASHIANRLQQVLDDWNYLAPQLQDLSDALQAGKARHAFAFDPTQCMAPLPRAYQCVTAYAYPSHLELVPSPGADTPEPRSAQRASDALLGPCADIVAPSAAGAVDFGAGLAVLTDDLPAQCSAERALDGVRLLLLVNEVTLRDGPQPGVCASAFAPLAVTPDELGPAWSRGRLHLPLQVSWNGRKVGMCDAGADMGWHFGKLLAHLCQTRRLGAGSLVCSGPVSNKGQERRGRVEWPQGYSSIAERRARHVRQDGQPDTPFLAAGDTLHIEMKDQAGTSVFGAIAQTVVATAGATAQ